MSERTDERTAGDSGDADVEEVLDDGRSDAVSGGGDPLASDPLDDEDFGVDVDALTGEPDADSGSGAGSPATQSEADGPGLLARLRPSGVPNPLAALPSGRSVLLTFGVVVLSVLLASSVPLLGAFGGVLGVFAGAFVLGLVSGTRRYVEFAVAGAVVSGLGALQGGLFRIALLSDVGVAPFAAVGAGVGLVAALLGHYFGRDLRDGLTASVE